MYHHLHRKLVLCLFLSILNEAQGDKSYWYQDAGRSLVKNIRNSGRTVKKAKNIILFIADGMSLSTVTAARILDGQIKGHSGEENNLVFDGFENIALVKTYNEDSQTSESAASATALLCGVKTRREIIGLDDNAIRENCNSTLLSQISSIADWAHQEGLKTGVVTTSRVTHATPAAFYAHTPSRYWERDERINKDDASRCKDITRQLVEDEPGKHINVIFGGGRKNFLTLDETDPHDAKLKGMRRDKRKLIQEWLKSKENSSKASYVWNRSTLKSIDTRRVEHVLGLFSYGHMSFEADRYKELEGEPSLSEMTEKAIEILDNFAHGFLLVVEAGRIDHAHHRNNAYRALTDTLALNEAIAAALNKTNSRETLIVVTSDHSHVMTFGNKAERGNNIFSVTSELSDTDGQGYSSLFYGNGPGFFYGTRGQVSQDLAPESPNYIQDAAVPRAWATHGAEDVPLYAHGLNSFLFTGVTEQSYIPHALGCAAWIGPFKELCQQDSDETHPKSNSWNRFWARNTSPRKESSVVNILLTFNLITAYWCYIDIECIPSISC